MKPNLQQSEYLHLLRTNVEAWNKLRTDFPKWEPDLTGSDLSCQDLSGRNLAGISTLKARQLKGSDLTDAILPDIDFGLKTVEDASKHARTLFVTMLLGCVYCWLSILTLTDVELILDSAKSKLPIINVAIKTLPFYQFAPILMLGFYLHFQLYLQHLFGLLAQCPAKFSDGTPLDQKAFPWLLNTLVRVFFKHLPSGEMPYTSLRLLVGGVLAWLAVPITLFGMWFACIPRHDGLLYWLQAFLFMGSVTACCSFFTQTRTALSHLEHPPQWMTHLTVTSQLIIFLPLMGTWEVVMHPNRDFLINKEEKINKWFSASDKHLRFFDADLRNLVRAPEKWTGSVEQIKKYQGLDLRKINLNYANLEDVFLINAKLNNLQNANLDFTKLNGATLNRAKLQGASFIRAQLQSASFIEAQLQGASLSSAQLQGAFLNGAQLQGTSLNNSQLQGAHLSEAQLQGASLSGAQLHGAILIEAQLQGASLTDAQLQGAFLARHQVEGATLLGTNLEDALFVNLEQLVDACIYETTLLPLELWIENGQIEDLHRLNLLKDPHFQTFPEWWLKNNPPR